MLTGNGQSSSPGPSAAQCKAVVNTSVAAYLAARAAQLFSVKPFGFEENFFSSSFILLSEVKSISTAVRIGLF